MVSIIPSVPPNVDPQHPPVIDETMHVTFEYPGGITHAGAASYLTGEGHFTVEAEKGTFACQGASFSQRARGSRPEKIAPARWDLLPDPGHLQLAGFHDHFAEAIRRKTPFICPGEMGLREIKTMERFTRSVAQGRSRVLV